MAAWREISSRLHPTRPDLLLLADRAAVLHLLGQTEASKSDVARLVAAGFPQLLQLRLGLVLSRSRTLRGEVSRAQTPGR